MSRNRNVEIVKRDILKKIYKKRDKWCKKKDFGSLLIVGGSKIYPTTPILVGLAAYRAGIDWVTIASPEESSKIIASYSPNLMIHPLKGEFLNKENIEELLSLSKKFDVVEIGGGLTRDENILKVILEFLENLEKPCVVDDDAIYAIAKNKEILKEKNFVLTPHSYEFFILSNIKVTTDLKNRIEAVKKFTSEFKTTLVLKGHIDVISNGERIAINKTGSVFMTKAGFGNTLAGILAAYLARVDSFTAACAAAYVNGKAGELASKKFLEGVLPTDLIEFIPKIQKEIL
ncbi:MAG: NAD(P)H-hydrate dehydratase [Candidatus Aenigmarchaeota archaeon]|nr:NAD(P)H-hydrate dehydratase [Candidatus Aenigmarchaeota archaeon]MDW8149462.1 NAD(P)H-hydrate dehydratase [Candidatus Aenigmarchaeota archaeon]